MSKLISCEFNIDSACVELKYSDGTIISIATRYDKRDDVFLAGVFLASILILLK